MFLRNSFKYLLHAWSPQIAHVKCHSPPDDRSYLCSHLLNYLPQGNLRLYHGINNLFEHIRCAFYHKTCLFIRLIAQFRRWRLLRASSCLTIHHLSLYIQWSNGYMQQKGQLKCEPSDCCLLYGHFQHVGHGDSINPWRYQFSNPRWSLVYIDWRRWMGFGYNFLVLLV